MYSRPDGIDLAHGNDIAGIGCIGEGIADGLAGQKSREISGALGRRGDDHRGGDGSAAREGANEGSAIGTALRKDLRNIIEQTYLRLARTRDDIDWRLFERAPSPAEMAEVAVWVDPALTENDRDGFVAEALVVGNVVVASRTTINVQRLEKGRTGFLVPPKDPNELTHAILAALFKPEMGQAKASAARQTISKFRPRQRLRALIPIYESLLP